MKKLLYAAGSCLLSTAAFYSCQTNPAKENASATHFIDTSTMDLAVKPGDNFFEYVNGGWDKKTTIPATESSAGAALDMYNRTKEHLHSILDSVAKGGFASGSIEQVSQDVLQLNEGTVYTSLLRLQQQGWITAHWGTSEKNRKAKFYSITKSGRRQMREDKSQWERLANAMGRVLAVSKKDAKVCRSWSRSFARSAARSGRTTSS